MADNFVITSDGKLKCKNFIEDNNSETRLTGTFPFVEDSTVTAKAVSLKETGLTTTGFNYNKSSGLLTINELIETN